MAFALVRLIVQDQAKWKTVFAEAQELRKKYGSKGVRAFAKTDNPNEIVILGEYESLDQARQLFQSQEFRDATQRAGTVGAPDVTFLEKITELPA
jgi:heme-degrading monooxygenase HmoA